MTSFKSTLAILASIGLLGATGCDGLLSTGDSDPEPPVIDVPPPPTPESTGEEIFNAQVRPLVLSCQGAACHSGAGTDPLKFLGPGDTDLFYGALVGQAQVHGDWDTTRASMIEKLVLAADAGTPHFGQDPYTTAEIAVLEAWFEVERLARDPIDPNSPDNTPTGQVGTRSLLAQWAGCMTLDNWNASQMGDWENKQAGNDRCRSCHNDGQFWININPTNETMFQMNRTELFIAGFFAVELNADGSGTVVPAYPKLQRMGQAGQGNLHPQYNTELNDQYFQYLQNFYDLTQAKMAAGTCGPAEFQPL